ncbi:MAG: hypothetical protein ACMG6E_08225 [Candidatus Roizmanbacteria bacterium]
MLTEVPRLHQLAAHLVEHGQGEAEYDLGPLQEEQVPDPEQRLFNSVKRKETILLPWADYRRRSRRTTGTLSETGRTSPPPSSACTMPASSTKSSLQISSGPPRRPPCSSSSQEASTFQLSSIRSRRFPNASSLTIILIYFLGKNLQEPPSNEVKALAISNVWIPDRIGNQDILEGLSICRVRIEVLFREGAGQVHFDLVQVWIGETLIIMHEESFIEGRGLIALFLEVAVVEVHCVLSPAEEQPHEPPLMLVYASFLAQLVAYLLVFVISYWWIVLPNTEILISHLYMFITL